MSKKIFNDNLYHFLPVASDQCNDDQDVQYEQEDEREELTHEDEQSEEEQDGDEKDESDDSDSFTSNVTLLFDLELDIKIDKPTTTIISLVSYQSVFLNLYKSPTKRKFTTTTSQSSNE